MKRLKLTFVEANKRYVIPNVFVVVVVVCFNIWLQTLIYETCISD